MLNFDYLLWIGFPFDVFRFLVCNYLTANKIVEMVY